VVCWKYVAGCGEERTDECLRLPEVPRTDDDSRAASSGIRAVHGVRWNLSPPWGLEQVIRGETQYYKRQAVRDGEENAFEKRRDDRRKRKFRHFLEEFLEFD
jgi:hypothetical protein